MSIGKPRQWSSTVSQSSFADLSLFSWQISIGPSITGDFLVSLLSNVFQYVNANAQYGGFLSSLNVKSQVRGDLKLRLFVQQKLARLFVLCL